MSLQKITLVTDAWLPQVNGVVTTLQSLVKEMQARGITIDIIEPSRYQHFPLPTYKAIPIVWRAKDLEERIVNFQADAIYIATEGGLGWKARNICTKHQLPFATGYHTKYPEYLRARLPIPTSWTYQLLKFFHGKAHATLVPSPSLQTELTQKGFHNLKLMTRGFNTDIFNPQQRTELGLPKPVHTYVGRIAPEKNLSAFLDLNLPGSKVIVGDGPAKQELENRYPEVHFVGVKRGEELARYYASSDVFVFPSLTDTFGVVNIEAMACGTPVAAFPVTGPIDIINQGINGYLDKDLKRAIQQALTIDRNGIPESLTQFSWQAAADAFIQNITPPPTEKAANHKTVTQS